MNLENSKLDPAFSLCFSLLNARFSNEEIDLGNANTDLR